ncbi:MAG TPA: acetyl-CoA C-acyltransferase [Acidimicrobiales bacterium]|nr:acetyl-CoA C-acyltransferase [Acidimicrobiales bacterium]
MPEAVIVATARSPIGRANKGSLIDVRADDLMASIIKALMEKLPQLDPAEIDDLICGNVAQAGETGFNIARVSGILAGLPLSVPGHTVQRFCASSLQGIRSAAHAIRAGEGEVYLCAGVEKSTRPADAPPGDFSGLNMTLLGKTPGLPNVYIPMGLTAENVAAKYGISRERQDEFAALSQARAAAAQENGFFEREISPITKADGTVVDKDDCPRPGTTVEKLSELKPAFKPEGGTVTAGNACPLNDGAAAVMVMSDERAKQLGITPLARIVSSALSGNEPELMGVAPKDAVPKALKRAGMTIGDIDVVELNEAFAAQVLPVCDETGIDIDTQLNPHGGAIALGHPFGSTGARIMTTLINDLQSLDKTYGLETMCAAGGMAMAMVIERLN